MAAWSRILDMGESILEAWAMVGVVWAVLFALARRFKIQRARYDASLLRHDLLFSALTLGASAATIGILWGALRRGGQMTFAAGDAPWWVMAGEFAVYFFAFDLYFYALHRLMHLGPVYRWVHATHHRSTAPGRMNIAVGDKPPLIAVGGPIRPWPRRGPASASTEKTSTR